MGENERMFLIAVLEAAVKWLMSILQKGARYASSQKDKERERHA